MSNIAINQLIDHTVLKAVATEDDIRKLCQEAIAYEFKSVCVNPVHVKLASKLLDKSVPLVCTVIGFPLGANTVETKMIETVNAVRDGADEIDMVINIGRAKEHDYKYIEDEIRKVLGAAGGRCVKVIIETCYLTEAEKVACCMAADNAGATFVKTSTGFGTSGAILSDVITMRKTVRPEIGVKASGGVRTLEDLEAMVKAGANRIGTSAGVAIMNALKERGSK